MGTPLAAMWEYTRPLLSKKDRIICLVLLAWTHAFIGPFFPFAIHCLDCFLASRVWYETMVSSIVTMLSNIAREWQWMPAMNSLQFSTP